MVPRNRVIFRDTLAHERHAKHRALAGAREGLPFQIDRSIDRSRWRGWRSPRVPRPISLVQGSSAVGAASGFGGGVSVLFRFGSGWCRLCSGLPGAMVVVVVVIIVVHVVVDVVVVAVVVSCCYSCCLCSHEIGLFLRTSTTHLLLTASV